MEDILIELLGAAGGDINGAKQEFKVGNDVAGYDHQLFEKKGSYKHDTTDDTFMTWAVAEGLIESYGKSPEEIELAVTKQMKEYAAVYPDGTFPGGYGGSFKPWVEKRYDYSRAPGNKTFGGSCGNGSAMRIASVGALCDSLEETIRIAGLTALGSHWDKEGIKGAQALAAAGYLARAGADKKDIRAFLETRFGYNLDPTVNQYRYYTKNDIESQSEVCPTTVPIALAAFLEGNSYEECIRNTVFIGGDTDTIGAMVGGLAAAYYGIPKWLKKDITNKLDKNLQKKLEGFQKFAKTVNRKPDVAELENALAKARLEKHALEQYKADPEYVPNKDPKYFELLAEVEATRLFYDEVNRADLKGKEDIKKALSDGKKVFVDQLKENLMNNSAELKKAYESSVTSLAKTVEARDYDQGKRKIGIDQAWTVFANKRAEIDRNLVPGKIVDSSQFAQMLVDDGIKKLENAKMQIPVNNGGKSQKTDGKALDGILDEVKQYYSSGNMPEQLTDVFSDINKLRGEAHKFDTDTLRDKAFDKLQKFSNELVLSSDLQKSADSLKQIALINKFADAVKNIPNIPLTEKQYKAHKEAAQNEAKEVGKTKLAQYENYRKNKDPERAALKDYKAKHSYYAKNRYKFATLKKQLENCKTFTNSSEYNKIIEALGDIGKPLSDKKSAKKLDDRQTYATKLLTIRELVQNYIKHKAVDGVKKNVFHKLAAVEELDEFLTVQIKSLGLKDKFAYGKKIFDPSVVEKPQAKPRFKSNDIIEAYNSAKNRYKVTADQVETARTIYFMDKIIGKAEKTEQIKDLKDMQRNFLECPGIEENMPTRGDMAKKATESLKKSGQFRSMTDEKIKLFNSALKNNDTKSGYLTEISPKLQRIYQFAMIKDFSCKVNFESRGQKVFSASSLNSTAKSEAKKAIDAAEHPGNYKTSDAAKTFAENLSNEIDGFHTAAYGYCLDNYGKDFQTLSNLKLNDVQLVEKWPEISLRFGIYQDCFDKSNKFYPQVKGLLDKYEGFEKRVQDLAAFKEKGAIPNEAKIDNAEIVK